MWPFSEDVGPRDQSFSNCERVICEETRWFQAPSRILPVFPDLTEDMGAPEGMGLKSPIRP